MMSDLNIMRIKLWQGQGWTIEQIRTELVKREIPEEEIGPALVWLALTKPKENHIRGDLIKDWISAVKQV